MVVSFTVICILASVSLSAGIVIFTEALFTDMGLLVLFTVVCLEVLFVTM